MKFGFAVDIVEGDALEFEVDVLMVKYASNSGGLDARIRKMLKKSGSPDYKPDVGENFFVASPESIKSHSILIVGTVSVFYLDYAAIRTLGYDMLASLPTSGDNIKHVATTLHGVNTALGNDETEAFRSLLLGFADAYEAGQIPSSLERITIIDREKYRVLLMQEALTKFLPPQSEKNEAVDDAIRTTAANLGNVITGVESFSEDYQKPVADESTPHIFVAMPFSEEFDDHYYLAIRPAIEENNLLSVQFKQQESTFTGDIMDQVKKRIESAQLVIALLDTANPNVYLEVGYAWGIGTPTILILHEDEEPPFDVQGARLILYKRMHMLKEQLIEEIRSLLTG